MNNDIYVVSWPNVKYTSNKYPKIVDVTDAYLWHYRLSHINENRMNRLAQERILNNNDYESLPICESCLLGMMTKSLFIEKNKQARYILMYMDP